MSEGTFGVNRQRFWVTARPTAHSQDKGPPAFSKDFPTCGEWMWPLCPAAMSLLPWCAGKKSSSLILLLTPVTATAFPMCPPLTPHQTLSPQDTGHSPGSLQAPKILCTGGVPSQTLDYQSHWRHTGSMQEPLQERGLQGFVPQAVLLVPQLSWQALGHPCYKATVVTPGPASEEFTLPWRVDRVQVVSNLQASPQGVSLRAFPLACSEQETSQSHQPLQVC